MTKYNTEFKMKVVKEYLEGQIGYKELSKNTISKTNLLLERGLMLMKIKAMRE